ncbi:aminotransferase class I/II-fold pyridoxal phosphate-dependent enzyme [Poriferisphaera sp. WC338]|uniref:aminotransferase class I/II-fold pyridoxal phosphate-dependent enzyme n=1 Tax=Poriferisphaera sp. WC338 TaxID=3425129 RepID=UPI003D816803
MPNFRAQLQRELDDLEANHLLRHLRIVSTCGPNIRIANDRTSQQAQTYINLASNDYLGISEHPSIKAAVAEAVQTHGIGSGASKLVTGHSSLHEAVEKSFASFKHAERAIFFPTGYMANLAALTSFAGPGDLICLDKLVHASLIDAAKASAAEIRTFPHLDASQDGKLPRLLSRHLKNHPTNRRLIVTDSIFSMDGDAAQLYALAELAARYDAILVVDEAHGTGVLGEGGAGLAELQGVASKIDVTISTASKALGGLGGMITADKVICDTILNHARSIIYTTSIPPAQVAAIDTATQIIQQEPEHRHRLQSLSLRLRAALLSRGWELPPLRSDSEATPIIPLILGDAAAAIQAAKSLLDHGFYAPAIRPPTVAPGSERVRISLRADLSDDHLNRLIQAIEELVPLREATKDGTQTVTSQ